MELKDILMPAIAILAIVVSIWQACKNQKLQNMTLDIQTKYLELQEKMSKSQQQDTIKKELKPSIDRFNIIQKEKSDLDLYSEHIYQKYEYLDFTGLNALLQKRLLLEEVYVRLRAQKALSIENYRTIADFKGLDEEIEKVKKCDHDFVSVFLDIHRERMDKGEPLKAVILGHPGSGKTTLMKWIALQCACPNPQPPFASFTPVFIALKDLGRDPVNTFQKMNILELTLAQLKHEAISASFITELFETNHLLFLLDGIDEVADEKVRRQVIDWIQSQNIRKNSLLITSRFSGMQESRGMKFHDAIPVYSILNFDINDIEGFLKNWYTKVEIALMHSEAAEDISAAKKKGEERFTDIMRIIKSDSYKKLRELAVNPLLLTVIALVHRRKAVLPKERHRLYSDALEIMILLWNEGTGKPTVGFTVDNCLNNLSKLAMFMMKNNCRELEPTQIEELLDPVIENQPWDFFLKEMLLKAGLLYHSEGKYGFLHLTFQEYLAAWYFAKCKNPKDILEYKDKDYWIETFKLFVNIANTRQFFDEIIDYLVEKNYWQRMDLWDECLQGIVVEEVKQEIELKFARKVLAILPDIEYNEKNEEFILQLYAHYPLYTRAAEFVDYGWKLFLNARHPFVQSVGSSILNKAGSKYHDALMKAIKERMDTFEKLHELGPEQMLYYLYQNSNSFVLLIGAGRNLTDFIFALTKLQSTQLFLVYLNLIHLLDLLEDLRDLQYLGDLEHLRHLADLRYYLTPRGLRGNQDLRDLRFFQELRYLRDLRDLRCLPNIENLQDLRRYPGYLRVFQSLLAQFKYNYESRVKTRKQEINEWSNKSIKKLHSLPNEKLLEIFPNTTLKEITYFKNDPFQ